MEATVGLWLTIIAGGVLTFLTRFSFIAVHGRVTMPEWFTRALNFVPITVLSAIIMPELMLQDGELSITPFNPRLIAGLVAVVVAWRTKNVTVTIVAGMLLMWGLQYILGIK